MRILHTEASPGWGGQERRVLEEAMGMRDRGHLVYFAVEHGSCLGLQAEEVGFNVLFCSFSKVSWPLTLAKLLSYIRAHQITHVNTHSSLDSWIGGIAGRLAKCGVVRTRHISNPIKKGLNSHLLYRKIPHRIAVTCEEMAQGIREATGLSQKECLSIPTGLQPNVVQVREGAREQFRKSLGYKEGDIVVGTVCVLRGWKGVADFLEAAYHLRDYDGIKWVVVGDGPSREYFVSLWKKWGLEGRVTFTGYIPHPYEIMSGFDLFSLLSYQHEGVSQASLQAAWLAKPLITTNTGGLKEVCLQGKTGLIVPAHDGKSVAQSVLELAGNPKLREQFGRAAKELVKEKFLFPQMLDQMEALYASIGKS